MANEVLNKYALAWQQANPDAIARSLGWGPWAGGMVTPALKKRFEALGVPLIGLEAGARALVHGTRAGGVGGSERQAPSRPPPRHTAASDSSSSRRELRDKRGAWRRRRVRSAPTLFSNAAPSMRPTASAACSAAASAAPALVAAIRTSHATSVVFHARRSAMLAAATASAAGEQPSNAANCDNRNASSIL